MTTTERRHPRHFGPSWARLIDWRTPAGTHYRKPYAADHIRWAPGSRDTLVIESPRRRFRLCVTCRWRRRYAR